MKKFLIACLLLSMCYSLRAQTVKGTVYRSNSDTVVANAVVYYSGSIGSGTLTDKDGGFELKTRNRQIPIIVSCVGYYTSSVTYKPGELLVVRLRPKLESLHEVTIHPGIDRSEEIAMFKKAFLGTSYFALNSSIANMDDINIHYDKRTRILTADCDKAIEVDSKALGYHITYYLDHFEQAPLELDFAGHYTFTETVTPTDKTYKTIMSNREEAYEGSRMQFVRALWHRTLNKTVFRLYAPPDCERLKESNIIIKDSIGQQYVHIDYKIYVINTNTTSKVNAIIQDVPFSFIDQDGYYGAGIKWSGRLLSQRVGDLLPFDYQSAKDRKHNVMVMSPDTIPEEKPAKTIPAIKPLSKNASGDQKWLKAFEKMVLSPDNPINGVPIVKKWEKPIYYKIYGNSGDKKYDPVLYYQITKFFKVMAATTGLSIREAKGDSVANFRILLGNLGQFKTVIDKETYGYFKQGVDLKNYKGMEKRTGYYYFGDEGFSDMSQWVDLSAIGNNTILWSQVKAQILTGMGFLLQNSDKNSLFFVGMSYWQPDEPIIEADQKIIDALYKSGLKAGMTEKELEETLKGRNAKLREE